ncbi:MAG: anthranilate phosphoribosyltransferase, partial [Nitrososphaerota archaeon]
AETLMNLGCAKAMVVHGMPGLDEFSTSGPSYAIFINNGTALSRTFLPEEIGLQRHRVEELSGGCVEENAKIAIKILRGLDRGARQDFVIANAAAAILAGGQVKDLREGVEAARISVESGEAYRKLRVLVQQCGDIGRLDGLVARYG